MHTWVNLFLWIKKLRHVEKSKPNSYSSRTVPSFFSFRKKGSGRGAKKKEDEEGIDRCNTVVLAGEEGKKGYSLMLQLHTLLVDHNSNNGRKEKAFFSSSCTILEPFVYRLYKNQEKKTLR
jgi:hypothetical protein